MEAIALKLELKSGMHVLDIECGWGGLACYLAQHHGVIVTGISRQHEKNVESARLWAEETNMVRATHFKEAALSTLDKTFDRIVCVALSEIAHLPSYHELSRLLCWNGKALVHRAHFSLTPLLPQTPLDVVSFVFAEEAVDITASFESTLHCWLDCLSKAWSRGRLQVFEVERRAWEFTLRCLLFSCRDSSFVLEEVVYTKAQATSTAQPK